MSNGVDEIPPDIVAAIEECLGDRVQHGPMYMVRVEGKQLRLDPKIMVLSPHRAFLMAQKTNTKIDAEFNYLEIHTIESTKSLQLQFHTAYPSNKVIKITTVKQEDTRAIIEHILISLKKTFPLTSISKMIPKIFILPPERNTSIHNTVDRMTIPELGPCGGFTQMYACMCDLHGETYQAEVAWDVDTIYLSQDSKELCLNDFDHLESKDLVPIVASLMYNAWFTKLTATNVKLSSDICKEIKKVMTKSTSIEHLVLDNVGIKADFAKELNTALIANPNTALRHLDLSNNLLEDKGVRHLAGEITKLPNGLVTLRLSKIGMTAESTVQLGKALLENNFMPTSLIKLDLSGNPFKEGDINNLTQFLATPNAITQLDLSDTEIPLDNVFNALYRGCCANLSHLNLSGNVFSYRKNPVVPQAFKQYFATATALKVLNLSRNKLPPDVVKEVILGIGSNSNLQDIELDLSSNELRMAGGRLVESCIANVPNITKLNLSDNDLNTSMSSLLAWIGQNKVITSLDISQNLTSLRPGARAMMKVIDAIVDFIQNEETSLTTLSLAGNKLKFETIQIINALGSNTTLSSVDISGNGMGDLGARMLAKALMINTKLRTVALDSNNITAKGFADIAAALERNYTLKYMPTPVNDVSGALKSNAEKTQEALQKIQTLLQRNHSPHKFSDDQAFRLQQGFLYTTSHQLVDQLVVKIQDTSKDLADCDEECVQTDINRAKNVITDADNSKQLLAVLYKVALDSEDSEMINKLEEIVTHVQDAACKRLEDNVSGMLEGATDQCSHMMKDPELRTEIEMSCQERKQLPERFMQDVMEQVSAAIFNRISEANLAVASIISDTIIDEIIEQLTEYQEKLAAYAKQYGKGRSSFCNDTLKTSKPEEVTVNGQQEEGEDKKEDGEEEENLPKPKKKHKKSKKKSKKTKEEEEEMVQDKRKSVKVRPRSSVVRNEYRSPLMTDETGVTITDIKEDEEHAQNNSHSPSHQEEPVAASVKPPDSNDTTDGALFSSPAKPIEKPASPSKKKKEKGLQLDDKAFNELSAASQTRLQDVRKTRPRRPGGMRPTRAGITPQNENNPGDHKEEEKVDAGLDAFYKSDASAPELTVGKGSLSGSSNSLDTPKDEKSSSIGGRIGGLFRKKPKTPKPDKPKPVKEEKPKTPKEAKPKAAKREKKGLFGRSKKSSDNTKAEEDSIGQEPFQGPNEKALQQALENKKPSIIPDIKDSKQDSTSEEEPLVSSSGDELERDIAVNDKDATKPEESNEVTSKSEEPGDQRKQSYKPPGARGMPGMGMGMPVMGGGNMLAEMKKKQDQRRASNKSQEVEAEKTSEESTPEVDEPKKKVDEPEKKVDEPEKKADEPEKRVDEPEKKEDEPEKKEDKEEKEIKQTVADKAEKEREENKKEEEKEDKPEENATPTETVKTPEVDSQEKRVPLNLSLRMPSDQDKVASPTKPPSPRISPKPTHSPSKPLPSPTKPTPSPKSSPRTSGIFVADKRASAEIAKAEEEAKEVNKKENKAEEQSKKEEPEPSKDEEKTQEDHQESKPQVKLRKPRTPTPTDKRKSIPTPDPEKRKSNPLPVMAKRKSGTPVGADKLIVPINTQNKSETESSVKALRNSKNLEEKGQDVKSNALRNSKNLEEKGQDVKSNGEQPKPTPRPSPRVSTGGGPSPPSKPKPVPKPRPPSGVPPPSVAPKPKGRKSRDGPIGFSSSSSIKLPANPPGVDKPRSKSLDPNFGMKLPQQVNENATPVNGNTKKESISSIEEDEEDPTTQL